MFGINTFSQLPAPYDPFVISKVMNHHPISGRLLGGTVAMNTFGNVTNPSFSPFITTGAHFPQTNHLNFSGSFRTELDTMRFALLARAQRQVQVGILPNNLLHIQNVVPTSNLGVKMDNYKDINQSERALERLPEHITILQDSLTLPKTDQLLQTSQRDSASNMHTTKTEPEENITITSVEKVLVSKKM